MGIQRLWLLHHAVARAKARVSALADHIAAGMRRLGPRLTGETRPTGPLGPPPESI